MTTRRFPKPRRSPRFVLLVWLAPLLVLASTLKAEPTPIVVDFDMPAVPLAEHAEVLYDPSGAMALEEVRSASAAFRPLPADALNLGFRPGNAWFRFRLENPSGRRAEVLLATFCRSIDHATLYSPTAAPGGERSGYRALDFGDFDPFGARPIHTRYYTLPLRVPAHTTHEYFLRWHREGRLVFPAHVVGYTAYFERELVVQAIHHLSLGVALGLLFYNLCLYWKTRERAYLRYSLFVAFATCLLSLIDGSGYRFWPDLISPEYKVRAIWILLMLTNLASVQFARAFLDTYQRQPRLDRACQAAACVAGLGCLVAPVLPMPILESGSRLTTAANGPLLLATAVVAWCRGYRPARTFLIAFGAYFILAAVAAIANADAGILPLNIILLEGARLGFCLNLILLSIALGNRINELKDEQARSKERAAAEAAEASAKSRFLATMSHQVSLPMNGVLGVLDLLRNTSLDVRQKRYVDTVHSSWQSLMSVLNDICYFAKIESGQPEIECVAFDLEKLLDECAAVYSLKSTHGRVFLAANARPGTPLVVKGDPARIRQILTNLLSNAFKFTHHGSVRLSAFVQCGDAGQCPRLRFEVSDTGVGVPRDERAWLVELFSQTETSTSFTPRGAGLGLVVCKQLAERMNGSLGFESEPGRGSTFWLSIPLKRPGPEEEQPELVRPIELAGKKLLVADGCPGFRLLACELASSWAMWPTPAGSVAEAFELALRRAEEGRAFDLAVIACELPDGDGLALAARLRKLSELPAVLVAARGCVLLEASVPSPEIGAVLEKPITAGVLRDAMASALRGRSQAPGRRVAEARCSGLRVLIADDSKVNQMVILAMLSEFGVTASVAENGLLAVNAHVAACEEAKGGFDLILMDCEMPEMDGFQATREIRAREARAEGDPHVRIVALSGHPVAKYRERALACGMDDYVTKPLSGEDMEKVLLASG